jgi:hypothetical protein
MMVVWHQDEQWGLVVRASLDLEYPSLVGPDAVGCSSAAVIQLLPLVVVVANFCRRRWRHRLHCHRGTQNWS